MANSKTILIVDDDGDLLQSLTLLLQLEGYQVVSKLEGEAALRYLESHTAPDVILLDLMMPKMNGWQFRDRIKADPRLSKIPMVVMTASRSIDPRDFAGDGLLYKPFDVAKLIRELARYANFEDRSLDCEEKVD